MSPCLSGSDERIPVLCSTTFGCRTRRSARTTSARTIMRPGGNIVLPTDAVSKVVGKSVGQSFGQPRGQPRRFRPSAEKEPGSSGRPSMSMSSARPCAPMNALLDSAATSSLVSALGEPDVVGIHERQVPRRRPEIARIPRFRAAPTPAFDWEMRVNRSSPRQKRLGDRRCIVGRSVVDDHALEVGVILRCHALERLQEVCGGVVGGDHHPDPGMSATASKLG